MALVVFLQEEAVPSVHRNLKIFCETPPGLCYLSSFKVI